MIEQFNRPMIMGILNVTPDSFSDGGDFIEQGKAVAHGLDMVEDGADILDIGGESTRPGAARIDAEEQIRRVIPVIKELMKSLPDFFPISIDTTLHRVAEVAVEAGATMINDISSGEDDENIFLLAASTGVPIVLMHKQGTPENMQQEPHYENVVEEVKTYLLERAKKAETLGVEKEQIILDPGIGFGKTKEHNLQLMNNLDRFVETGYSVLLGASRKAFLKKLSDVEDPRGLVGATCATTVMAIMAGVHIIRVHDVKQNKQALEVAFAMRGL